MGFTHDELVERLSRKNLEILCMCLLQKREVDGINGRMWDACKHLAWEDRISIILKSNGYLGHISDKNEENEQGNSADNPIVKCSCCSEIIDSKDWVCGDCVDNCR